MSRLTWFAVFIALAHLLAAGASAQEPAASADQQEGQRLALQICTACHVVSADQQFAPILRRPAPDFRHIANQPNTTAASLATFLRTTHATMTTPGNMPWLGLDDKQVRSLVSYILSLRAVQPVPGRAQSRPGNGATGH